jgi:hypothetical protein
MFIWSADNLLALTLKTFVTAFFLLLLIRAVPRRRAEATDAKTQGSDQES